MKRPHTDTIPLRRHHNTKGTRQIKRGKTATQLAAICKRLGLPFKVKRETEA